ncbi:MAG: cytochrome c [Bacteroidota bacterium]
MRSKYLLILLLVVSGFCHYQCELNPYKQGEILYLNYCASCHMDTGQGLRSLIPPLAQADYLIQHQGELPCIIRYGIQDSILVNGKVYNQPMTGIKDLTDVEITNIINYVNQAWGNAYGTVRLPDVQEALKNCE